MYRLFNRFLLDGPYLIDEKHRILVISDLHLGYSNYLASKGIYTLIDESKRIKEIISYAEHYKNKIDTVIFNGDIIHDFGSFPFRLKKKLITLIDELKYKFKLIFIEGNHDIQLKYAINHDLFEEKITLLPYFFKEDLLISHGHTIINRLFQQQNIKFIILGHEHPAVIIDEKKFKAYLIGTFAYKHIKAKVIYMPSFFDFVEGTNYLEGISPYKQYSVINQKILIYKYNTFYFTIPIDI